LLLFFRGALPKLCLAVGRDIGSAQLLLDALQIVLQRFDFLLPRSVLCLEISLVFLNLLSIGNRLLRVDNGNPCGRDGLCLHPSHR
jgi:hypothetical protein